jgi:hypothetical protein
MTESDQHTIIIENIQDCDMALLIEFSYLRDVRGLNCANCFFIMTLADYFGFLGLLRFCVDFMIKNILTPDNCVAIFFFLDQIDNGVEMKKLKEAAWSGILNNFTQIDKGLLKVLPTDLFKRILSDDHLNVKEEQLVWNTILKWIDHNQTERLPILNSSLMRTCRLGLLPQNVSSIYSLKHHS